MDLGGLKYGTEFKRKRHANPSSHLLLLLPLLRLASKFLHSNFFTPLHFRSHCSPRLYYLFFPRCLLVELLLRVTGAADMIVAMDCYCGSCRRYLYYHIGHRCMYIFINICVYIYTTKVAIAVTRSMAHFVRARLRNGPLRKWKSRKNLKSPSALCIIFLLFRERMNPKHVPWEPIGDTKIWCEAVTCR